MTAHDSWPTNWPERKQGVGCGLCESIRIGTPADMVKIMDLDSAVVWMPRFSSVRGYILTVWSGRHVAEMTSLTSDEVANYSLDIVSASRAVEQVFEPAKINLLTLGNRTPHLHTHIVPRYIGDPAPGLPLTWSQIVSETPLSREDMDSWSEKLRWSIRTGLPR
jgi:diadenosine tetraphosphate (Ap4A) HIT family hydrolase